MFSKTKKETVKFLFSQLTKHKKMISRCSERGTGVFLHPALLCGGSREDSPDKYRGSLLLDIMSHLCTHFTPCSEYLRPDYSGTEAKILE